MKTAPLLVLYLFFVFVSVLPVSILHVAVLVVLFFLFTLLSLPRRRWPQRCEENGSLGGMVVTKEEVEEAVMMTFALVVVSVDGKQVEDQYADAEAVW